MSVPHFSLSKRSNQIYYIGYYVSGRRRWKSTGATLKPDALKALTQFKELMQTRARSVSLQQFIADFLAYGVSTYSPKTLKMYEAILGKFSALVRDISLGELNPQHVDRYKAVRLSACKGKGEQKISPISVNVELRMLKAAFNTARRWKMVDSNIFEGVSFAEVPERAPVFFSRSDFEKLLQNIKHNWLKEAVVFSVVTGVRRGELVNLRWQDVDLQRRVIQIQSNGAFKTKQGRKRTIPLNKTALLLLRSKQGKDTSEYLFTHNGKQIDDEWLSQAFRKAVKDAKLGKEGLHWHSLRHTFSSWLVQDGASLFQVQQLLGHVDSKTTQVYAHLQPSEMHSTVNRIDLALN